MGNKDLYIVLPRMIHEKLCHMRHDTHWFFLEIFVRKFKRGNQQVLVQNLELIYSKYLFLLGTIQVIRHQRGGLVGWPNDDV